MPDKAPKVTRRKASDYSDDPENANLGSERGAALIEKSFTDYGAGRSILVDKNGVIIAGNKSREGSLNAGIEEVIEVESDGKSLIVVKRTDLDLINDPDHKARKLAYLDNQASAVSMNWNAAQVLIDMQQRPDVLAPAFTSDEVKKIIERALVQEASGAPEAKLDQIEAVHEKWKAALGDLWLIPSKVGGEHRLVCGDCTDPAVVKQALGDLHPGLMVTDPPYGVEYDPQWREDYDVKRGSSVEGSHAVGKVENDDVVDWSPALALFPGDVMYVWHAGVFAPEVGMGIKSIGFAIRGQIIWRKQHFAMSRGAYHWQHEPCQPAGTMVRTPDGEVPIESLRDGDRVVSYDSYSSVITGLRDGREIKVAQREYDGELYTVGVAGKSTRCTDAHQFTVRFKRANKGIWCTYLMRRGNWWRTGILRTYNSRGFGLKIRIEQEAADEAWILGTYDSKVSAGIAEQINSVKYGIPTTHWVCGRSSAINARTPDQITEIYAALDLVKMEDGACQALIDYGRRREYSLCQAANSTDRFSTRVTTQVRACNLIPLIMELPIPNPTGDEFKWKMITDVSRADYHGIVYSLDVDINHHYVADGIVTHNCWYAVRKGKSASWRGDRTQSTIWDISNMNAFGGSAADSEDQPTGISVQKPIETYRRMVLNHTLPGDAVYDPFGGSGTMIVAAELTARLGISCELNPKYVSIILERCKDMGLEPRRAE